MQDRVSLWQMARRVKRGYWRLLEAGADRELPGRSLKEDSGIWKGKENCDCVDRVNRLR